MILVASVDFGVLQLHINRRWDFMCILYPTSWTNLAPAPTDILRALPLRRPLSVSFATMVTVSSVSQAAPQTATVLQERE